MIKDTNFIRKNYELSLDSKIYELTISFKKSKNENIEKIFNFLLKEKNPEDINNLIYYEKNKKIEELVLMFPKSKEKYPNQEEFILRQIYNYYSNNYISLSKINNSIELIFNLKIESSEEVITISIELNKINKKLKYEDLFNIFNKKINQLNKELEDMKFNYKINLEKKKKK